MGDGKLIIHLIDAMDASLLEDLLFEIKSGEHTINTIGYTKVMGKPAEMAITFKEGKLKQNGQRVRELIEKGKNERKI
jgi:hypothetical protein